MKNTVSLSLVKLDRSRAPQSPVIEQVSDRDIAIIGMAAEMPDAADLEEFWRNLYEGHESVADVPEGRRRDIEAYLRFQAANTESLQYMKGAFLREIDRFDHAFFNVSPKEASLMNPIHRLFLQTAWHSFEDAGYPTKKLSGTKTGVFIGIVNDPESYKYREMLEQIDPSDLSIAVGGNLISIVPGRVSYTLNLRGPSMVVDTACSSSLVALHLACQALRNGDCEMALAGGARLILFPLHRQEEKIGIESTDERTKAFDQTADGSGVGEGVVAFVLKPLHRALRDGDHIHAIIKGSATNQDGTSMGMTAPNPEAQAEVLTAAWQDAGINPETLSYIEAHGTGTRIGDPIELEGINSAFRRFTDRRQFCAIGSVKTNLGHLYASAGLAGVLKAVLALKRKQLPPHINFARPNSGIDFSDSSVFVNVRQTPWETEHLPRRCGVSSFGLSGTNCHVVLEEAPERQPTAHQGGVAPTAFVLSAKSEEALRRYVAAYTSYLEANQSLGLDEVCFTASSGREHYTHRLAIIATSLPELRQRISDLQGQDLAAVTHPWFFYGEAALVGTGSRRGQDKAQLEKERLSSLGRETVCKLRQSDTPEVDLRELCSLYVAGAEIDWEELYHGRNVRRVSLPTYPFERTRCWLDFGEAFEQAAVSGMELAPVGETWSQALTNALFFGTTWTREDLKEPESAPPGGAVLILADHAELGTDLAKTLQEAGREVLLAYLADSFAQAGTDTWQISGTEADYVALLESVKSRGVTQVVVLVRPAAPLDTMELAELEVLGLYRFLRAMAACGMNGDLGMAVVTQRANEVTPADQRVAPSHAAVQGLASVAPKEFPNLKVSLIDVDETVTASPLALELNAGVRGARVAYRKGARFVQEFDLKDIGEVGQSPVAIAADGAYLITGGLGGIGLEMARYLVAQNSSVKLGLVGRSGLPPREQWEAVLQSGSDMKACRAITAIREMEEKGAQVSIFSADVSDYGQVSEIVAVLRRNFGRIRGVIHAAGVGRPAMLSQRTEPEFLETLSPKVAGTWVIDELTRTDSPDFFVFCSSVAAVFGASGQTDYAAANAFQDAYAAYRNAAGLRTLSINWTTWKETGMAADQGFAFDTMFKALPTDLAIDGFNKALNSGIGRVLIGALNVDGGGARLLLTSGVRVARGLAESLQKAQPAEGPKAPRSVAERKTGAVKLLGRDSEQYTETERFIAELCRQTLGYPQVDVNENFFEMGADSILLTRIRNRIEERFPGKVQITDLFQYPTIAKLSQFIASSGGDSDIGPVRTERADMSQDIAIVGMAVKLPMADSPDELWENLVGGINSVTKFPEARQADIDRHLEYVNVSPDEVAYLEGAYLDSIDSFDYNFFRIAPREASFIDPHQRLFLETAWQAIEDAGYGGGKLAGSKTGVYLGFTTNVRDMYSKLIYDIDPALMSNAIVGNATSVSAGRIAYMLDLRGPAMMVDTACSSGLVALDTACQAIRTGRCDAALVGGIKLIQAPLAFGGQVVGIGMEASDNLTRTFDHYADGTAFGEGVEVIMIKPLQKALADGDHIHAVIKGSAVNQDGNSAGITAPNPESQVDVLLTAWEESAVDPETLSYVETHGTGTQLGDPIEISSLQNAFRKHTGKKHFCAVGSVKTNLGHLSEGAGLVGLVKAVMALKHGEIPGNLYFNRPSSMINFIDSPIYVNTKRRKWEATEGAPRRCGVSAFGMSGTNAHVVLEEYSEPVSARAPELKLPRIFTLSARTPEALTRLLGKYKNFVTKNKPSRLGDVCFTANTGRGHYPVRMALVADDFGDFAAKIFRLADVNLPEHSEADVFFGVHTIVSQDQESRNPGDLTAAEREQLTAEAAELLERYAGDEKHNRDLLKQLCSLYVRGAEVDWEQMHVDEEPRRVSLPTYQFDRTRCWIDVPARPREVQPTNSLFHVMGWKEAPIGNQLPERAGTAVLLTGSGTAMSAQVAQLLKGGGMDVLEVQEGEEYGRVDDTLFRVRNSEEDYRRLFNEISDRSVSLLVHLSTVSDHTGASTEEEQDLRLKSGLYSGFYLSRALADSNLSESLSLYIVSPYVHEVRGDEPSISPENAALCGLGKVIGLENPSIRCRVIDVDPMVSAEQLVQEFRADCRTFVTAYREGVRYVEEFREIDIEAAPEREVSLREGGVYVLTGGLGGIGSVMARHLAARVGAKLVLINRSKLPDRDMWDDILASGEDEKLCRRLSTVRELEALGAEVACYSADVSKAEELGPVIADARRRFGQINGVIHGAGIASPGIMLLKDEAVFQTVVDPKIRGTWLLDQLTADDNLDFFALFSSGVTYTGEAGQADYTAANYYLDSYAAYRNRYRKNTVTIDWVSWADAGMSVEFGINVDTLFRALPSNQAVNAFERLLSRDLNRVMIGEFNAEYFNQFEGIADALPFELHAHFRASLEKSAKGSRGTGSALGHADAFVPLSTRRKLERAAGLQAVRLSGRETQDFNEVEEKVAQIYSEVLGFSDINIYDSFFELGGDSIMLSRMHVLLEKEFPGQVKMAELFDHTSVSKLAQHLTAKMQPKVVQAKKANEGKTDEELDSLLDMMQSGKISVEDAVKSLTKLEG